MKKWEMWKDVIVSETYQTGHTFKEALENNFKNCSIRYDDTYVWILVNDEAVSTAEVKLVDIYEDLKEQIEEMKKKENRKMKVNEMWDMLINYDIATEEELNLIADINGYNEKTLLDVLHIRTHCKNFKQLAEKLEEQK